MTERINSSLNGISFHFKNSVEEVVFSKLARYIHISQSKKEKKKKEKKKKEKIKMTKLK